MKRPAMTAFVIWFTHFMLCWVAVERWPGSALANQLAWGLTAAALAALLVHGVRVGRHARDAAARQQLVGFNVRFAQGALVIATVAVLFTALPSLVLRP